MDRSDVLAVLALPPEQRVARLVEMKPDEMMDFKAALRPAQKVLLVQGMTPDDEEVAGAFITAPERVIGAEILESRLERDVFSQRQLQAVMTDFWLNHFSVYLRKNENEPYYLPSYERDVILPNALGKFENLLVAVAQSPAMLMYLDNWESVGPNSVQAERAERAQMFRPNAKKQPPKGINENYGRELMELHTLGVNGGYTQKDVTEVARCFTGWTILEPRRGGGFFYNDKLHDKGEKVVLGHVIAAGGGIEDGEKVLDILAHHPSTAHFISRELAQRFVADNPPDTLVEKMSQTFLSTDGDIREVMKTMLASKEFWSEGAYRAKIKSPFEMVASSVRALNGNVADAFALANQVGNLGEPLYRKLEPTGYSNLNSEWVNSAALLGRMNFALQLAQNRVAGVKVDLSGFGNDPEAVAKTLMYRTTSPQTRSAIDKALEARKQKNPSLVAGLVIGSPDFQKR
jgi:uncharacterized protein (DUF1800 family)